MATEGVIFFFQKGKREYLGASRSTVERKNKQTQPTAHMVPGQEIEPGKRFGFIKRVDKG